jgi:hypothetical protein
MELPAGGPSYNEPELGVRAGDVFALMVEFWAHVGRSAGPAALAAFLAALAAQLQCTVCHRLRRLLAAECRRRAGASCAVVQH